MNQNEKRNKTLCFSGHRTEKLPKGKNEFNLMKQNLMYEIHKATSDGYDTFMFGACYGFDLICAQQILMRKQVFFAIANCNKMQCKSVTPLRVI